MREYGLGRPVPRSEDLRLLTGRGRYTDDIRVPDTAQMFVLRSPHAAARIVKIDTAAARAMPGVVGVFTGEDIAADGIGTLPCRVKGRTRPDGTPMFVPPYRLLALGAVRFVGDGVAVVVAESIAEAKDAAEQITVDYEELPAVVATGEAGKPGAPVVWPEVPDNIAFVFKAGDEAAVNQAFVHAAHVAKVDFTISRVAAMPMEVRDAIGVYDPSADHYTLYAGVQAPHLIRSELAAGVLKIPDNRLRVVSDDVGGAFGMKGGLFPELGLVLWASRKIGRPVKWICERSEAFVADHHARDNVATAELALDQDGRFLGLRLKSTTALGAYLASSGPHPPAGNLGGLSGVYTTPAIYAEAAGVFTNNAPTSPYRGAGRPEASYALERVIDVAAAELGIDRVELRRRNLIPASAMPYKTGFIFTYDSGAFEQTMDKVLALADWAGFEARRQAAAARGTLAGIALVNPIEIAGGPFNLPNEESAEIRFDPSGSATVLVGTHSQGQGHETAFRQIAHHALGIDPEAIRVLFGDTDKVIHGRGTFGSRSVSVGGAALVHAAEKVITRGKAIAAHLLEAAETDIDFKDAAFSVVGTDRRVSLAEVAKAAYSPAALPPGMELGLAERSVIVPPGATFPNGSHVAEVEVDPETGSVKLVAYSVVDDVGRIVNPLLLEGQVHGGVAQGAGQALLEAVIYDPESGQLLTGSFMDYGMPRADDLPSFRIGSNDVPAKTNPLGIKGAGESGTVGALPAVVNAVVHALSPLGIRHIDMPTTPEKVWRAIQAAKTAKA